MFDAFKVIKVKESIVMTRAKLIELIEERLVFCKKYDNKTTSFSVDTFKDILFYLKNKDKDEQENEQ